MTESKLILASIPTKELEYFSNLNDILKNEARSDLLRRYFESNDNPEPAKLIGIYTELSSYSSIPRSMSIDANNYFLSKHGAPPTSFDIIEAAISDIYDDLVNSNEFKDFIVRLGDERTNRNKKKMCIIF